MGFLKDQASRLTRTKWGDNADLLALEIASIMRADVPFVIDGPVTINNTTNDAPLTIRDFGDSEESIVTNKQKQPPPNFPEFPPFDFDGVGRRQVVYYYPDGSGEYFDKDGGDPVQPSPGTGTPTGNGGGGGGFPGVVTSGTGDTYAVDVYESGLSSAPTSRSVRQLSIAGTETIPPGTWALVGKVGSDYFMQVPTWLADLT